MIQIDPVPQTLASRAAGLFDAYRDGDAARMPELVALLTPILWHTARAQRLDEELAEDVVQSVWLALVRSADTIADPQAVLQWLIVTARRESWRAAKRSGRYELRDFQDAEIIAPIDQRPEELVLRSDTEARLWTHISGLPERCRALLRVIAFADRPDYAALAAALGMPVGSIGPTRGRCLAKLRLLLEADQSWEIA